MTYETINFTLKDGRSAVLRSPKKEDADGLLSFIRAAAGQTPYLLMSSEEAWRISKEREEAFIANAISSPDMLMLVCEVGGEIAGNCQITFKSTAKVRHRAEIGIGLVKKFWNLGIGTAMMNELIRAARANRWTEQVELSFIEGNSRARALYEKVGFRLTAVQPDAIKLADGTYLNEYFMTKKL